MPADTQFSKVLRKYTDLSPLSYAELARRAGLPNKTTISNWLNGAVKRPRHWKDIVQLAQALNLDSMELDELLRAASLPSLLAISKAADSEEDVALLAPFIDDLNYSLQNALFRVTEPEPQLIIGRKQAIDEMTQSLIQTAGTCITHGMGGVGKTLLAAHIAYSLRPNFPEGVLWINVAGQNPIGDAYQFIASTYKISPSSWQNEKDLKAQIWELLEEKRVLLIFDGLQREEHLEKLLPPNSKCSILVTTQINHFSQSYGKQISLSPFTERDCEELFASVLGKVRTEENIQSIHTIARLVGRLPLAIHIVASYLLKNQFVTIREYAEELEDEQNRLQILSEDSGKIDYEIEACFEMSFKQLPKSAKDLFPKLAIFAGTTFSQKAIQVIGPKRGFTRALGELITYSLLEEAKPHLNLDRGGETSGEGQQKRFQLNPMLRLFAQQKLQPEKANRPYRLQLKQDLSENFNEAELIGLCFDLGIDYENLAGNIKDLKIIELLKYVERNDLVQALQSRVLELRPFLYQPELEKDIIQTLQHRTSQYFTQLVHENKAGDFSLLDIDQENILYSVQWAANNHEWDLLIDGLQALTFVNLGLLGYLDAAGLWRQALKQLQKAITNIADDEPTLTQAILLFKAGAFEAKLAEFTRAKKYLEQALNMIQAIPEENRESVLLTAYIYDTLAQCEMQRDQALAIEYALKAQNCLNKNILPANDPERGYFWIRHSSILGISGQLSEAKAVIAKGLPLLPKHPLSLAHVLGYLAQGGIFFSTDHPAEAIAAWEKGVEAANKLGDIRRKAMLSQNIAVQSSKNGDFNKAENFFRQAQEIYKRVGDTVGVIDIWLNYGHDCMVRGQDLQAYKLLQQALKSSLNKGGYRLAVIALLNLARLALMQEKADEAARFIDQAASFITEHRFPFYSAELHRLKAHHAIICHEFAAADSQLEQAMAIVEDQEEAGIIWQMKGTLAFQQEKWEEAKEAYNISIEKTAASSKFEWTTSVHLLGETYLAEGKDIETGKRYLIQARENFSEMNIKQKVVEIATQLAPLE